MTFRVKETGKKKIMMRLAQLEKGLPNMADTAITLIGRKIKEDAQEDCPVGTPASTGVPGYIGGSLKKSGRLFRKIKSGATRLIRITFGGYIRNPNTGKIVDYAKHVHDGTSRMPARPFLQNSINRHARALLKAIIDVVKRTR